MVDNDWKWIDEYENMYRIYIDGRVESVKRKYVPNNIFLKPHINKKTGYSQVSLRKNGKGKTLYIHRLIAIAFIENPNPEKFDFVDHEDQDRLNNSIKNLRWVSPSGNCMNRKSIGSSKYLGVNFDKATGKWKAQIRIGGKNKHLGYFEDEEEASEVYMEKHNEMMKEFEKI